MPVWLATGESSVDDDWSMKSPFPGLDPYLDQFWSNVHTRIVTYAGDQLQQQLPDGLWINIEEGVSIDGPTAEDGRRVRPDAHIMEDATPWNAKGRSGVAEPITIPLDEPFQQKTLEIVDVQSGENVITAIEVISPANRNPGRGRAAYLAKQRSYLNSWVNMVEIDLIRAGYSVISAPGHPEVSQEENDPVISVYRHSPREEWEVYPLAWQEPLPRFRIPLRADDEDIVLDLQEVLEICYRNGRFDRKIDYSKPPHPPIPEAHREWLRDQLTAAGLRP